MRTIKFRGIRVDNGEWACGDLLTRYIYHEGFLTILDGGCIYYKVLPETVGQNVGFNDINGAGIYEGDILHCHDYDGSDCGSGIIQTFKNAVVGFEKGNFYYYLNGNMKQPHRLLMHAYKPEVIGNIYQNKELLTL